MNAKNTNGDANATARKVVIYGGFLSGLVCLILTHLNILLFDGRDADNPLFLSAQIFGSFLFIVTLLILPGFAIFVSPQKQFRWGLLPFIPLCLFFWIHLLLEEPQAAYYRTESGSVLGFVCDFLYFANYLLPPYALIALVSRYLVSFCIPKRYRDIDPGDHEIYENTRGKHS